MELTVVQGDALEFNLKITDVTGEEYALQKDEKIFFMAGAFCTSGKCEIHEVQENNYFLIEKVELQPGTYDFEIGIIFADGTVRTLIEADVGKLKVKRRLAER